MRRFFHRQKGQQSRQGSLTHPTNGAPVTSPRSRSTSSTASPLQGPSPPTNSVRQRAPALRSRSMSVLYGQEPDGSGRPSRFNFSRSLSFCSEHPLMGNQLPERKELTQSEEDEVFKLYTKKLYVMLIILIAVITGVAVYAFVHNIGKTGKK